jgi:hypothetical protein
MSQKACLGDVFEIPTSRGLSYAQYVNQHRSQGMLVRLLPGAYASKPADLLSLVSSPELYFVFYTLEAALKRKLVQVVANLPVPRWARSFPTMRKRGGINRDGSVINWLIVDGGTDKVLRSVTSLSAQEEGLSIASIWPHEVLVSRIEDEWTPERAEELRLRAATKLAAQPRSPAGNRIQHYLYFPTEEKARSAAREISNEKLRVEVKPSASSDAWLVLVKHSASEQSLDIVRSRLEKVVSRMNGEYDGWRGEAAPPSLQ